MQTVILGAGYAGLTTALRLARQGAARRIVLVNDRPEHQLTTQLHKVAAGATPPRVVSLSLERLLRGTPVELCVASVRHIEPKGSHVVLDDGKTLGYDRLVVALGSRTETFGVPGVLEHAFHVQPLAEAVRTRDHIAAGLEQVRTKKQASYRIVVVGGGLTGVELAGELADAVGRGGFDSGLDPRRVEITLLEAGPRLLPGLHPFLGDESAKVLQHKGVRVQTNRVVRGVTPEGVLGDDGLIPADAVLWAAGVRAHSLTEAAFSPGIRGRALVDEYLRAVDTENVYVLGDNAAATSFGAQEPAAPTAQNAVQQAAVVADNIAREARGAGPSALTPYTAKPLGVFVSVGQAEAVGELVFGDVWQPRLTGFSAYAFKWASEQRYRLSIGAVGAASSR